LVIVAFVLFLVVAAIQSVRPQSRRFRLPSCLLT